MWRGLLPCGSAPLWEAVQSRATHAVGHEALEGSEVLSVPALQQSISCSWRFATDPGKSSQGHEDRCLLNAMCILQTDNGAFCYHDELPFLLPLTF